MANVSLVEEPKGVIQKMAFAYSRRKMHKVVDPVRAAANHSGVLVAMGAMEGVVEKSWKKMDPHLRWLALQATAGAIGCSWCTDFGYFEGMQQGVDPMKVRDVFRWRQSEVYDERERTVLEYVEAVTATPAVVSEELAGRLRQQFTDPEIVELTGWIALENFRSRFNAGSGLHSEGFSDHCDLPAGAVKPEAVRPEATKSGAVRAI
jgi:alkylhydroperoxidase family enzyme